MGDKNKQRSLSTSVADKIPIERQYEFIGKLAAIDAKLDQNNENLSKIKSQIENLRVEDIHTILTDFDVDTLTDTFSKLCVDKSISQIDTKMNGHKNDLKFSGKYNESVTTFLQKLSFLEQANAWSSPKYFAQILLSLNGAALRYYNNEIAKDPNRFKTEDDKNKLQDDPQKLREFLKKSFEPSETFSDILSKVVTGSQRRNESVDDFANRMINLFERSEVLDEKIQMGLILNGLRSDISQALEQRTDISDMNSMITWARKLESIYYKHKTNTPIVATMEESPNRVHYGKGDRSAINCYTCGGNHLQRNCNIFKLSQDDFSYRGGYYKHFSGGIGRGYDENDASC